MVYGTLNRAVIEIDVEDARKWLVGERLAKGHEKPKFPFVFELYNTGAESNPYELALYMADINGYCASCRSLSVRFAHGERLLDSRQEKMRTDGLPFYLHPAAVCRLIAEVKRKDAGALVMYLDVEQRHVAISTKFQTFRMSLQDNHPALLNLGLTDSVKPVMRTAEGPALNVSEALKAIRESKDTCIAMNAGSKDILAMGEPILEASAPFEYMHLFNAKYFADALADAKKAGQADVMVLEHRDVVAIGTYRNCTVVCGRSTP
ncbi:MAG: hypothetical protein NC080_07300 [Paraprevotella sp.]|nr:hypothetical protein [Paraprevotella sp.]